MYVFHSTVRVKPELMDEFIANHREAHDAVLAAPGFLRRLLLKDKENPGTFFYMSFWRSFADLEAYRASAAVQNRLADLKGRDLFAGPIDRVECEVISDETVI